MIKKILFLLLISFIVFSCKHELENPTWETDMIVPIAHSNMNISDMITEVNSDYISSSIGSDSLISIVFSQEIIDMDFDALVKIDAVTDEQTHTLDSASFNDVVIADTSTIGETINEIPLGPIIFPNGSTNSIPAIQNVVNEDTVNVDASEYFETMTLIDGILIFEIKNKLPTDISNVDCSLINSINQNIIASFNFPLILSGSSQIDTVQLTGLTIDKNIDAVINNVDVNASNGNVSINYSDGLISKIKLKNLQIDEATAYFPKQELSQNLTETSFDLGDAQITEIGIKTGLVNIHLVSTIQDTGRIIYNIPSLSKNGTPFSTEKIVPTTINGESTIYQFNFEDYVLDLKGKSGRIGGDTVNTIYSELYTYIDSTGELVTLNKEDSFYYHTEFIFTPKYALGYLGTDTINIGPEIIESNIFNNIISGELDLDYTTLSVEIENYFGADAIMIFNSLESINSNTGENSSAGLDQSGNNFIGHNYEINRAILNSINPEPNISSSNTSIVLDSDDMLNILPDKINTSFDVYLNPNGPASAQDFLFTDYPIDASIQLKVPLNIIANNLQLLDTAKIDIDENENIEIEKIFLKIENGFPINCNVNIIFLDNNQNVIDTLFKNQQIISGVSEGNIVIEKSISLLESENVNLDNVSRIVFDATFLTEDINNHVSIYNDYSIDFILSTKFSTRVN